MIRKKIYRAIIGLLVWAVFVPFHLSAAVLISLFCGLREILELLNDFDTPVPLEVVPFNNEVEQYRKFVMKVHGRVAKYLKGFVRRSA